jgi:polysaccharide biosynthesis/export protein
MKIRVLFLFALLCGISQISPAQEIPSNVENSGYLIGPGDIITIKVLGEPDFNVESIIVDEDGKIEVPFFNTPIYAKCRTEKELRIEVTKLLTVYLKSPQATVYVKERKSRPPVIVFGEVNLAQQIPLTRRATLRELIAFSGGPKKEASGMIQVTRTHPLLCSDKKDEDWKTTSDNGYGFPSRLFTFSSLRDVNPEIYPGDIIDVQKAAPVYVVGEVIKPGEFSLPEGGMPLMQAVASAGGLTREARQKVIKVYRRKQGTSQPEVIIVDYNAIRKGEKTDVMLEPFDIVEVGKSKKNIGDIFIEALTGAANRIPIPIRPF